MQTIRLLLVDDHEIVRKGLKTFLEGQPDMQVIAEVGSGQEAIEVVKQEFPDVILMDISMPDMDGLEATRQIKLICPECKVLALTVHADQQYFFNMLEAGAEGYVTKQAASDELIEAVRAAAEGYVYLQPPLARWLLDDYKRLSSSTLSEDQLGVKGTSPELNEITEREKQVLTLVAEGYTSKEVGRLLGISPKTVSRHKERIMRKLDIHSCVELVKFAVRTGLISVN